MKRMISAILSLTLICSLAACGNSGSTAPQREPSVSTSQPMANIPEQTDALETTAPQQADAPEIADPQTGNVLVVYYSATGYTEEVANYIAAATNGDILELIPVDDYASGDLNWSDSSRRVSQEYSNPELRDMELVTATVENWEGYDTVFIGYPIWWGIAAWPVDAFVKANDFTGKTVIPFCTSSSSGLGDSGRLLAEMAETGNWQEGIRFRSGVSQETVLEWLNGLGL